MRKVVFGIYCKTCEVAFFSEGLADELGKWRHLHGAFAHSYTRTMWYFVPRADFAQLEALGAVSLHSV